MNRHTPGPWISSGENEGELGLSIYADNAESGYKLPAIAYGPNSEANARLIAAAPDLLEALQELLDLKLSGAQLLRATALARAAIAKANED